MSRASIDKNSPDFRSKFEALQSELQAYEEQVAQARESGGEVLMPQKLYDDMEALGVKLNNERELVDSASEKKIVFEEAPTSDDAVATESGSGASDEVSGQNLGADITQGQRDGVLAVDAAIKQNSNRVKNQTNYLDVVMSTNDSFDNPNEAKVAALGAKISEVGARNTDTVVKAYLESIKAVHGHSFEKAEDRKEALNLVNESFAFLGDEKVPHDLEACLKSSKKILESDKIPQDLKIKIEQAVSDIDIEVADDLQQSELENKEKEKEEEKEAKKDEKKKDALEKEKGINKVNIAKKTVKYGAALGVAAGFPPFGVVIAIGMLYVARNWGADEKEAKEQELGEGMAMMQSAKQRIAKAKSERLEEEKLHKEFAEYRNKEAEEEAAPSEEVGSDSQPSSDQGAPLQGGSGEGENPTATNEAIGAVAADALEGVAQARAGLEDLAVGAVVEEGVVASARPPEEAAVVVAQDGGYVEVEAAPSKADTDQDVQDSEGRESEEVDRGPESSEGAKGGDTKGLAQDIVRVAKEEAEAEAEKKKKNPEEEVKPTTKNSGVSAAA